MRCLILDTTALYGDWRLRGPSARTLSEHMRIDRSLALLVPEVVLCELEGQYQRELHQRRSALEKAQRDMRELADNDSSSPNAETPSAAAATACPRVEYGAWLRKKLSDEYNAIVLPIPDVSHSTIVERAVARQKPFDDKGRGYRDALIWYSVVDAAKSGKYKEVYFVTGNVSDFARPDRDDLHDDLLLDLRQHGELASKVTYFQSLKMFLAHYANARASVAQALKQDVVLHVELLRRYSDKIMDRIEDECASSLELCEYAIWGPLPAARVDGSDVIVPSGEHVLLTLRATFENIAVRRWHSHLPGALITRHRADLSLTIAFYLDADSRQVESMAFDEFEFELELLPPKRRRGGIKRLRRRTPA